MPQSRPRPEPPTLLNTLSPCQQAEKEPTPPPEPEKPKPFKLEIKKKEKKATPPPEPEPVAPEEMFKLAGRKKSSLTRKVKQALASERAA